ncbi:MAG: universal stress protein [Gammaproteobacteria bacterium]
MYKHILVATDLSSVTKTTVSKAFDLAKECKATLSIIHVIEPIPAYGYPGITPIESPHIDEISKELSAFCQEFKIASEHQHVEVGPPKAKVLEVAKTIGADLIVVGSHGRHGIFSFLGSTANAILHSAPCDVLTIRAEDAQ